MRNERGNIAIDPTEKKRIIKEYYEQLYANKSDKVDEMDKFLERHKLPRLTQDKIIWIDLKQVKWLNSQNKNKNNTWKKAQAQMASPMTFIKNLRRINTNS